MGKLNQCDVTNTTGSYTCTTVCQKWKEKHNRWDGWLQNTDRTGTATENWLQHWLVCRLFPDQSINRFVLITVKMPIVMIWYLLWAKKRNSKFSHLRWCRREWPTRTINRLSQLLSIKIHTNDSKSVLKIALKSSFAILMIVNGYHVSTAGDPKRGIDSGEDRKLTVIRMSSDSFLSKCSKFKLFTGA